MTLSAGWLGCAGSMPSPPAAGAVTGREWALMQLEGQPVTVADEAARPTLRLDAKEGNASGMAGVNRYRGSYQLAGSTLKFGPLLSTKMAGSPAQNALETRFLWALEATTGWQRQGRALELLAGTNVIARFEVR